MPRLAASLLSAFGLSVCVWGFEAVPVDPLVKVFPDDQPVATGADTVHVARGETVTFQVALLLQQGYARGEDYVLTVDVPDLAGVPGEAFLVGMVPVDMPAQDPSPFILREPPADFPDPLYPIPEEGLAVDGGETVTVWFEYDLPTDVEPGAHTIEPTFEISWTPQSNLLRPRDRAADPIGFSDSIELTAQVYDVAVGGSRLKVTNWLFPNRGDNPDPYSEEWWDLMRVYAENMAAHRQNVIITRPLNLAQFSYNGSGELQVDWSRYDRWVELFTEAGVIGHIESGHLGTRSGDWTSDFVVFVYEEENGEVVRKRAAPGSQSAKAFYSQFLPLYEQHLEENGWLDITMQHLADEPIQSNADSYREIAALVREFAPSLPIIEATHTQELTGAIDIWVPQLDYYDRGYDHYLERQAAGEEVWTYTCVFPQGAYANRFIEQPLVMTRLLPWIAYRFGATGFLHWGYNAWGSGDPYEDLTREHGGLGYLPAGDAWVVYPVEGGVIDSIRGKAMRDGIADYELLSMLAEVNPVRAARIAGRLVLAHDRYRLDIEGFREARREILQLLEESGVSQ
jgi:hypothetical protein